MLEVGNSWGGNQMQIVSWVVLRRDGPSSGDWYRSNNLCAESLLTYASGPDGRRGHDERRLKGVAPDQELVHFSSRRAAVEFGSKTNCGERVSKKKLMSVVGARPQFVKAAIVSDALAGRADAAHCIVHTGQHFDLNMSEVFFKELGIPPPAFNLNVRSSLHGEMTGRMLEALEKLFLAEKPDCVLVYGDTNSTLAGALAAAKLHIPLAHIEAGLRSFNRMPEEINRVLTDHVTDLHFSVTDVSTQNLRREGIFGPRVYQVGDVMYDCARKSAAIARRVSDALTRYGVEPGRFVLCTAHRANNTDDPARLRCLIEGLDIVSRSLPVILPVHPRTRLRMESAGIRGNSSLLKLVDAIGYLDMVRLELDAGVIVTDSGGVQREAFFHQRPCVTFRDETEWVELLDLGWNVLSPLASPADFAALVLSRIGVSGGFAEPYGDGTAGRKIADVLMGVRGMVFKR